MADTRPDISNICNHVECNIIFTDKLYRRVLWLFNHGSCDFCPMSGVHDHSLRGNRGRYRISEWGEVGVLKHTDAGDVFSLFMKFGGPPKGGRGVLDPWIPPPPLDPPMNPWGLYLASKVCEYLHSSAVKPRQYTSGSDGKTTCGEHASWSSPPPCGVTRSSQAIDHWSVSPWGPYRLSLTLVFDFEMTFISRML